MHIDYLPETFDEARDHLVEEMGEVLAPLGKIGRFGLHSVDPTLPPERQEKNSDWLKRELVDLKAAIARLETYL